MTGCVPHKKETRRAMKRTVITCIEDKNIIFGFLL
jgi:hypothetical protein